MQVSPRPKSRRQGGRRAVQGSRRGVRRAVRPGKAQSATTASAMQGVRSAAGGRRRLRSVGLQRVRRLRRHPRQHVRIRRSLRRRSPPRRAAARRRSALRPGDRVRGIGQGRRDDDSDSATGELRDAVTAPAQRRASSPTTCPQCRGPGTGSLPAGLLHRCAHLPAVPRRRQDHHQAVPDVPRRGPRSRASAS